MVLTHRRHDVSDKVWKLLEPHLPGREGTWGGKARDNRMFIMQFSGYYALAHLGVIYRLTMVIGRMCIADFAVAGIRAYGRNCWSYQSKVLILSGL